MKQTTTVDFSEIFHWSEKYGISWNQANDLFFRSECLTYKSYNEWEVGINAYEGCELLYSTEREAWDLTREEIDSLSDIEKAGVLIDIFLHENGVKEAVILND